MREQLSLSDIQYGPFLPFLRKKDVTDIDYNGRELWIRDIHNIRHKVTDEKIRQRLNEEFIQSFATKFNTDRQCHRGRDRRTADYCDP